MPSEIFKEDNHGFASITLQQIRAHLNANLPDFKNFTGCGTYKKNANCLTCEFSISIPLKLAFINTQTLFLDDLAKLCYISSLITKEYAYPISIKESSKQPFVDKYTFIVIVYDHQTYKPTITFDQLFINEVAQCLKLNYPIFNQNKNEVKINKNKYQLHYNCLKDKDDKEVCFSYNFQIDLKTPDFDQYLTRCERITSISSQLTFKFGFPVIIWNIYGSNDWRTYHITLIPK